MVWVETKVEKREEHGDKEAKPLVVLVLSIRRETERGVHAGDCRAEREQRSGGSSK